MVGNILGFGNYALYIREFPQGKIINFFKSHEYNPQDKDTKKIKCKISGDVIEISEYIIDVEKSMFDKM